MPERTNTTHGKATPFPHIMYSDESVCGFRSHLIIWAWLWGLEDVPIMGVLKKKRN